MADCFRQTGAPELDPSTSKQTQQQRDNKDGQEDVEQDDSNVCCRSCYTTEAKDSCDNRNHQEY